MIFIFQFQYIPCYCMLLHFVYAADVGDVGILNGEAFLLVTSLLIARSISNWLSLYVSVKLNRSQEGAARASKSSTVAHPEPKVLIGPDGFESNFQKFDPGPWLRRNLRLLCEPWALPKWCCDRKSRSAGSGWLHHEGQTPHGFTLDRTTMNNQSMLDIEEVSRSVSYQAGFAESCQLARTRGAYFAQQPQRGQLLCSSHWFQSISHSFQK